MSLTREEREKFFSKLAGPRRYLSLDPGMRKRFVCLTDFDGFVHVLAHRTPEGRVWCEYTDSDAASCPLCERGVPRQSLAAVSVWVDGEGRLVAFFTGVKRGQLVQLRKIFDAFGTHKVLIEISREGSGRDTVYTLVAVASDYEVPGGATPHSREEILEVARDLFRNRVEEGW